MDGMNDRPPTRASGTGRAAEADSAMRTERFAIRASARQARAAIHQAFAAWQTEHLSGDTKLSCTGAMPR